MGCIAALFLALSLSTAFSDIIPKPVRELPAEGVFLFCGEECVSVKVGDRSFKRTISKEGLSDFAVREAYQLDVSRKGVVIRAMTPLGVLRARQSLNQMLAVSDTLHCGRIIDWPRFPYRGLMMDISRNFQDKNFIIKQLEAMAMVKLNVLHLHLTDAAGWRIRIDRYPRLTDYTAWRPGKDYLDWRETDKYLHYGKWAEYSGGYLEKEDVREIVTCAHKLGIEVIPEIEMPGHSFEVTAAYPELGCQHSGVTIGDVCPSSEDTFRFFTGVLDEVLDLFPSRMIHIGGDEANRSAWKECPRCRELMERENITDVAALQGRFTRKIGEYLHSKGRRLVGWDEILEGDLPEDAVVMSWRGTEGGGMAVRKGHDVIMTPNTHCYFNYPQDIESMHVRHQGTYTPLWRVYAFDPSGKPIPQDKKERVLGVQANLWTEFISKEEDVEKHLYPRAFAISEIGWSDNGSLSYEDFLKRVRTLSFVFEKKGYHPSPTQDGTPDRKASSGHCRNLAIGAETVYDNGSPAATNLTDGKAGGWSYFDGGWTGFLSDLSVIINLGRIIPVHYAGAEFMSQVYYAGIAFPARLEVEVSKDGITFFPQGNACCELPQTFQQATSILTLGIPLDTEAQYIKIKAFRADWAQSFWLCSDELLVW